MSFYEPDEDKGWDAYCDETLDNDDEPTAEGFEAWLIEQEERAEDAAIEAAEAAREDAMFDREDY